jgi:hypothetical protein
VTLGELKALLPLTEHNWLIDQSHQRDRRAILKKGSVPVGRGLLCSNNWSNLEMPALHSGNAGFRIKPQ